MHEPGKPLLLTGLLPRNIALARKLQAPEYAIVDAGHKDGVRLRDYGRFGDPQDDACALLIECGYHGDPASRRVALDMTARSEEHTSELQSLMRISYAVFCLKKKKTQTQIYNKQS